MSELKIIQGGFELPPETEQLVITQKLLTREVNLKFVQVGAIWDAPAGKAPAEKKWWDTTYGATDLNNWVTDPEHQRDNVGFNLQNGWMDIDVDCDDNTFALLLRQALDHCGVDTRFAYGRHSRMVPTHYLVQLSEEDAMAYGALRQFQPKECKLNGQRCQVELRTTEIVDPKKLDIAAKQTVVPGSVHKSKQDSTKPDPVIWLTPGSSVATDIKQLAATTPRRCEFRTIVRAVSFAICAYHFAPHWTEGSRQSTAVKVTGWLARLVADSEAMDEHDTLSSEVYCPINSDGVAESFVQYMCVVTGDDEEHMRKRAFYDARGKLERNPDAKVPGWTTLMELLGSDAVLALRTVVMPGADVTALTRLVERYIYDESDNMYVDRTRHGQRIPFAHAGEALDRRHKGEVIFVNGKPKDAFRMFEASRMRKRIALRDDYPNLDPGAIYRLDASGRPLPDESDDPTARVVFNTWRGWKIKPAEVVNAQLMAKCVAWLDRLLNLLTNDNPKQVEWIKKWIAFTIQKPGTKQQVAWVVVGGQGVGKSFFGNTLMPAILGEDLWGSASPNILEGVFSVAPFIGKMFVFIDEAKFHQPQAVEEVKKLIRSVLIPGQEKGKDARTHRIFARLMFASNELQTNISQKDVRDRALYYTVAKNPDNQDMTANQFLAWANELKPWFSEYADFLEDPNVLEHYMHYFTHLPVNKHEIEDTTDSSINDKEVVETNASLARRLAKSILESGWICDEQTAWEAPFTAEQWDNRVSEEIKRLSCPRVPFDAVYREIKSGMPAKEVAHQERVNGVNRKFRKWPIRWGAHIKTFQDATSLELSPYRDTDAEDFGVNDATLKTPGTRRGTKASLGGRF